MSRAGSNPGNYVLRSCFVYLRCPSGRHRSCASRSVCVEWRQRVDKTGAEIEHARRGLAKSVSIPRRSITIFAQLRRIPQFPIGSLGSTVRIVPRHAAMGVGSAASPDDGFSIGSRRLSPFGGREQRCGFVCRGDKHRRGRWNRGSLNRPCRCDSASAASDLGRERDLACPDFGPRKCLGTVRAPIRRNHACLRRSYRRATCRVPRRPGSVVRSRACVPLSMSFAARQGRAAYQADLRPQS
jgi:hypothetical protein